MRVRLENLVSFPVKRVYDAGVAGIHRILGHVPALGVSAGRHYHYTSIGILGFAVASSPSMKDAAEIALRYLPLTFAFASFHIEDDGREFRFVGNYASIAPDMRRFFAERDLTAVLNVQRELLPAARVRPKRIGFAFPRPKVLQPYEEFFGVMPTFGAPRTCRFRKCNCRLAYPVLLVSKYVANVSDQSVAHSIPAKCPLLALTFGSEFTYHADPSKFATTVRFYLKAAHVVQKHHRR